MVVVAIMAIAITMSYPAIRDAVHRAPLTQAVMDVMKGCREARSRAILKGVPAELRVYQDGRLEVADCPPDQNFAAVPASVPTSPVNFGEGDSHKTVGGFSGQIPDTVAIELFEINFTDYMNTDGARIRFYSNGTSDELTMVLLCNGERRKISLEVVTALADAQAM
jgi:type II secretory pathway pseudopilin PulG